MYPRGIFCVWFQAQWMLHTMIVPESMDRPSYSNTMYAPSSFPLPLQTFPKTTTVFGRLSRPDPPTPVPPDRPRWSAVGAPCRQSRSSPWSPCAAARPPTRRHPSCTRRTMLLHYPKVLGQTQHIRKPGFFPRHFCPVKHSGRKSFLADWIFGTALAGSCQ